MELEMGKLSDAGKTFIKELNRSDIDFHNREDLITAIELERPMGSSQFDIEIEEKGIDRIEIKEEYVDKITMLQLRLRGEGIYSANNLKIVEEDFEMIDGKPAYEYPSLYVSRFPVVIEIIKELNETRRKFDDIASMQMEGKWDEVPERFKKYIGVEGGNIKMSGKSDLLGIFFGYETDNVYYHGRARDSDSEEVKEMKKRLST